MKELKTYNIQDADVKAVKINFLRILGNFLEIIPKLIINFVLVSFSNKEYLEFCWLSYASASWVSE